MKRINSTLAVAILLAGLTSCKNETQRTAERNVDHYVTFVDSVNNLDATERNANWAAIDAEYQTRMANAEATLSDVEKRDQDQIRIDESKAKYESVKKSAASEYTPDTNTHANASTGNSLRDSYFSGKVGDNMDFSWVNKDNILSVYQNFVDTFNNNKDSYSREDFDKVKVWYEALDSRKNTVEKEGLSSEDNRKIAALKLEFAPKFKWERMGAKADENADAKK